MAAALLVLLLAPERSLEARVNEALDRGAAHLLTRQAGDGSFNKEDKVHPIGRTALCTLAMLHAGLGRDHPAVIRAMTFLSDKPPRSTYEAGCLILLDHAFGKTYEKRIHRTCGWLLEHFDRGPKLWGYPDGVRDLSNTQFAAFGLRAGELHGFKVPSDIWRDVATGALQLQVESGAFRYRPAALYRATMTHAGLLCLHFATKGKPSAKVKKAMARGHKWYAAHYSVTKTPFGRGHHPGFFYYYMYGLERYAQIFGFKTIAGHDWYREGAEELLERQEKTGGWGRLEDTAFAILFLRKAVFTAPRERKRKEPRKIAEKPAKKKPPENTPWLRTWLVAGPYLSRKHEDDMLFERHFPRGRVAGKKKWSAYTSPEDVVDFHKAVGPGDWCSFYAALYLHAEEACEPVLWLATDDGCRVFLNGGEVLFGHHHDFSGDDHYRVPLKLNAGRNLLLVQVENTTYYAKLKARLTGSDGVQASTKRRP